jgi:hypothetical protein
MEVVNEVISQRADWLDSIMSSSPEDFSHDLLRAWTDECEEVLV